MQQHKCKHCTFGLPIGLPMVAPCCGSSNELVLPGPQKVAGCASENVCGLCFRDRFAGIVRPRGNAIGLSLIHI